MYGHREDATWYVAAACEVESRMSHVAVLLSGSFRTLLDCNHTLVTQIFQANPAHHFHIFAALTIDQEAERQQAERAAFDSYPCVAAVKVEIDADVTAAVRREVSGIDALPKGVGTAHGKAFNIVKMFRGIWTAQRLLRTPARAEQPGCGALPKSKAGYDMVLRVRPDLCFCKPLDLNAVAASVLAPGSRVWYVPTQRP